MKSDFVGREQYLALLNKRIRDLKEGYRQNVAIIGDEMVGKTSLVSRFLHKFYDTFTVVVYLEARPESLDSFVRRFVSVLLYNFLAYSNTPLREDLDFLLRTADKYIPNTVAKIRTILGSLPKRRKSGVFSDLLSLCDTLHQETGKFCVVIFDEFVNLEHAGIKGLYADWTKLLVSQKTTLYIIISSLPYRARAILSKNLSLLFGNFEVVTVEPFDVPASEAYLATRPDGVPLGPGLKDFVIHFTGGYPFYLEVVSSAISASAHKELADILEQLLFESSGILHQRFSNYMKRFLDSPCSHDYSLILHLIASGRNRLNDIAHVLRKSKSELAVRVNQLLESDAVSRSGDFLTINDRVFAFWLKFVHQNKMQSLTYDARNQKAVFRENIQGMIRDFMSAAQKPVSLRIEELMRSFADETVQFERKRLRLAHFREIKPLEFNRPGLREGLLGRSGDSLWILAVKSDSLTEEDVAEFAKECKKYRHRVPMKVIVALKEVDANARLRALEEKIMTWDLVRLNQIFDLFSMPRIIP